MKHILILTTAMLIASPVHATDLLDSWRGAIVNDPDYQGDLASRDAGREADVQSRALERPSIQFQGGYQYKVTENDMQLPDDLAASLSGTRSGGQATIGVQAVQPIYDASKRAQSIQLRERAAGAEVQFAGAQQALILRVVQAYFAVLSSEDKLASYDREIDAAEQQRSAAQARFDAGRARITDVREAEAQRDGAVAQRIGAEADLAYARAVFFELTGLEATDLHRLQKSFVAPLPAISVEEAAELGETRSPVVKAAEHSARAAGAETDRYRLAGRPVVEGVAGYQGQYRLGGESGNGIVPDRFQTASVGVRLTIPLYAGGAIKSKEREAQADATKAQRDLDAARRDARLRAQNAWYATSTGARRVAALRTAQASAELQQSATTTGRDVGIRTQNDVVNAQSRTFSVTRDYMQATYDYLLARLQLAAATGDLGIDELEDTNDLLTAA